MKKRYVTIGIVPGRRLSTFLPLDHDNRGFMLDGKPAPISIVNHRIYDDNGLLAAEPMTMVCRICDSTFWIAAR